MKIFVSKAVAVKKELIVDEGVKELMSPKVEDSDVINKLKFKNKLLLNELATKQCECPDKISNLEAKVVRLESNLAIEKHNNHDLINHINTIQKYKAKYYKTVEALKAHLPN